MRQATHKDLPKLVTLAKSYYLEKQQPMGMDEHTLNLQIRNLLINKNAAVFVNENVTGVAAGPLAPWPYDLNVSVLQEYLTEGEDLPQLKTELYKWAISMGAKGVVKLCVDETPGPRVFMFKGVI